MNAFAQHIERCALDALTAELVLEHKPGLVTPTSRGSHDDMHAAHFRASIEALSGYFADCARLAANGADFVTLRARGLAAEAAMFAATGGINTHKGAIFTVGLLAAAAGRHTGKECVVGQLGSTVSVTWGAEIMAAGRNTSATTHGARIRRELGLPGAREQAAGGFPVLFETTLPALTHARSRLGDHPAASLHALIATIAVLPDTNLAHRGGAAGLQWAQEAAAAFISGGSVFVAHGPDAITRLCNDFVARGLSPGGSADLLAAALMLSRLQTGTYSIQGLREAVTA